MVATSGMTNPSPCSASRTTALQMAVTLAVALAVALISTATILAAPPTSATIVEGTSMGKVRLSMTKHAVLSAFGKPAWCFHAYSKDDEECDWLAPPDKKIKGLPQPLHSLGALGVEFWKGRVISIKLTIALRDRPGYENVPLLTGWKTSKGIGLGSSPGAVRAAYPGAKDVHYSAGYYLSVTTRRNGKTFETRFLFTTSNVFQIFIGLIAPRPSG